MRQPRWHSTETWLPPLNLEPVALSVCSAVGLTFIRGVGAGAFKETFHVLLGDGTPQALKIYRAGISPERAQREIEAMVTCTHPNIARLSSIAPHQIGSTKYLVSLEEYLPGGTLTAKIQTSGLFSVAELRPFGAALVSAVAHVASHGLVHRDLKPDNIMLRADGITPVIVDFGLVRNLSQSSLTQTWLLQGPGTPLFSPAEQLHNEKAYIDWRADQFSLGVLLSISAFGFHPYAEPNDSMADIVTRVSSRQPPTDRFRQKALTDGFPALTTMVAPWPVQRFRTAEKLSEAWLAQ